MLNVMAGRVRACIIEEAPTSGNGDMDAVVQLLKGEGAVDQRHAHPKQDIPIVHVPREGAQDDRSVDLQEALANLSNPFLVSGGGDIANDYPQHLLVQNHQKIQGRVIAPDGAGDGLVAHPLVGPALALEEFEDPQNFQR